MSSQRLDHIDGLRGIACMVVLVHHFLDVCVEAAGPTSALDRWLIFVVRDVMDFGRLGVQLFFLISGYVIVASLSSTAPAPLRRFALSRLFRLYPAYWLSLAAALALGHGTDWPVAAANITMAQRFLGFPDVLGVYWSLAVELSFYGLCIVLFVVGITARLRGLVAAYLALMALAALGAASRTLAGPTLPFGWFLYLALMFAGAVLRHMDDHGVRRNWVFTLILTLSLLQLLLTAIFVDTGKPWYSFFNGFAIPVALFLSFCYVRPLNWSPLAKIGVVSYSLYLFHPLVGDLTLHALRTHDLMPTLGAYGALAMVAGASAAAAAVSYRLVERPAVALGRRLAQGR